MGGNFKVRCIKTRDSSLTVGWVYEFVGGYSLWDNGVVFPQFTRASVSKFLNFNDLVKWFGDSYSRFELIEEPTQSPSEILQNGMIVQLENGDKFLKLEYGFARFSAFVLISNYDEDDFAIIGRGRIVEIFRLNPTSVNGLFLSGNMVSVWKRKEKLKVTMEEVNDKFGGEVEIVAEK